MADTDPGGEAPEAGLHGVVDRCLERLEEEGEGVLEELCEAHPEHASLLRRWTGLMRHTPSGPQAAPGSPPRDQVGDFRLVRMLGRGGMGQVWEAIQLSVDRRVALKLLLPERMHQRSQEFFQREARAGGRLTHPGIVAVYGAGQDGDFAWIAMELVEGSRDLKDWLDEVRERKELPARYHEHVAELCATIADALEYAHRVGVIHRDLKPGNVLLTTEGCPKVGDFGLAKLVDELSLSRAGELVGTWYYMSPEQVAGRQAGLDHRTDLFSLGVLLYELLALQRPFEGDTTEQVAHKILWVEPPSPTDLRSRTPVELSVICAKCLEKDPNRRYGSMAELAADLRRFLAHEPIVARPPNALQRGVKWARRNPTKSGVGAVATIAFALIAMLLVRNVQVNRDLESTNQQLEEKTAEATHKTAALADAVEGLEARAREALRQSYSTYLHAAAAANAAHDYGEARRVHALSPEEFRGWEWDRLGLEVDSSLVTLKHGRSGVASARFSPDGSLLASCGWDGLHLWDWSTGEELLHLDDLGVTVNEVAFSSEGTLLASASNDDVACIWDVGSGELVRIFSGHSDIVLDVSFDPLDPGRLATASQDKTVRVWDVESGECLQVLDHDRGVHVAAFSTDGARLFSGDFIGALSIWDVETGELLDRYVDHEKSLRAIAPHPDGKRVLTGGVDGRLCVWDLESGAAPRILASSLAPVSDLALSPDGLYVVSGSLDGSVGIWDLTSGVMLHATQDLTNPVQGVAFDSTGSKVVAVGDSASVRIWDASTRGATHTLDGHDGQVNSVALSPDGNRVASASDDGSVCIWNTSVGRRLTRLGGHEGPVTSVAYHPGGRLLVSGSEDRTVRVWDADRGEAMLVLSGHVAGVRSVAVSLDGELIASGSSDATVRIWDIETGELQRVLEGDGGVVFALAFHPQERDLLALGSSDRTLRIFDVGTGDEREVLRGHTDVVYTVAFSHDGEHIVSGSKDETVRIWDLASPGTARVLIGHQSAVNSVAFSPDDARIVSGDGRNWNKQEVNFGLSFENTLRIWDSETGACLDVLKGRGGVVLSVAFSPDGRRIVSGSMGKKQRAPDFFGKRLLAPEYHGEALHVWESHLEDAEPWWRATEEYRLAKQFSDQAFDQHVYLEAVRDALWNNPEIPKGKIRTLALEIAEERGEPDWWQLNLLAWDLVDFRERPRAMDVARAEAKASALREADERDAQLGLEFAMRACELVPESHESRFLANDTLAWALFKVGRHEEALAAARRTLEMAVGDTPRKNAVEWLGLMERMVEAAVAGGP